MKSGKFARAILLYLDKSQDIINKKDYLEAQELFKKIKKSEFSFK